MHGSCPSGRISTDLEMERPITTLHAARRHALRHLLEGLLKEYRELRASRPGNARAEA